MQGGDVTGLVPQVELTAGEEAARAARFPVGATIEFEDLTEHARLAALDRLRAAEPVAWVPALGGWLVTSWELGAVRARPARRVLRLGRAEPRARVPGRDDADVAGRGARAAAGAVRRAVPDARRAGAVRAADRGPRRRAARRPRPAGSCELAQRLRGAVRRRRGGRRARPRAGRRRPPDALLRGVRRRDGLRRRSGAAATGRRRPRRARRDPPRRAGACAGRAGRLRHLRGREHARRPHRRRDRGAAARGPVRRHRDDRVAGAEHDLDAARAPRSARAGARRPGLLPNAIEEAMRLVTPVAFIERWTTEDGTELGDVVLGRGEFVGVSSLAASRDPAVFEDPARFDVRRAERTPAPLVLLRRAPLPRLPPRPAAGRDRDHGAARAAGGPADRGTPTPPEGFAFRKVPRLELAWD